MKALPFLISVPHGGTEIPGWLKPDIQLTELDVFADSDPFTPEIYNVPHCRKIVTANIARPIVDCSRSLQQMPPATTDGLIKSATCYSVPVYKEGHFPNEATINRLLTDYYYAYHNKLKKALQDDLIKIAFDCHSMANTPPPVSPDRGQKRPMINLGDADGTACPTETTKILQQCFMEVFDADETEISINRPFKGGFITRTHWWGV